MKPYAENKKAFHDFEVLEKFEGGLSLTGDEVKSIREGGAKLAGTYLQIFRGELGATASFTVMPRYSNFSWFVGE